MKAFSKKEIETINRTRPAYLNMNVSEDNKTIYLRSEDGTEHYELYFNYGPIYNLVANGSVSTFYTSLDEVRLALAGIEVRQGRTFDSFQKVVMSYLKEQGTVDVPTLVNFALGFERGEGKNPTSGYVKGRRWLSDMEEAGVLVALEAQAVGQRGRPNVSYALDTPEGRAERQKAANALYERQGLLSDHAEALYAVLKAGHVTVDLVKMSLVLDEEAVNKLMPLVNIPAIDTEPANA